jgi:threonyl-tRNA synthetase
LSSGAGRPICAAVSTPPAIEIKTPQLMDARQWEKSGHWGKYRENMPSSPMRSID